MTDWSKFGLGGQTDVSLEMKPGQITALVGLNSAGMSTCVRLLECFYQPQAGQILLDGSPVQSYKNQYLHDKVPPSNMTVVLSPGARVPSGGIWGFRSMYSKIFSEAPMAFLTPG
ncbi:hypothetical protein CRUP_018383 [Coryphaenoides rupestris]|nr:hypothetical protein CRUP_018383 [Coryphaenoides rupestris]